MLPSSGIRTFYPVGLELIVYSRVYPDNKVQLKLAVSTGEIDTSKPVFPAGIKGVLTETIVQSGETVVIGSVDQSRIKVSRPPGDTKKQTAKKDLIILLTPQLQ